MRQSLLAVLACGLALAAGVLAGAGEFPGAEGGKPEDTPGLVGWDPDGKDPVMIRLSLKVRWWQLGDDSDVSFVDIPELERKISEIRRHLEQFGQRIHLGIGWRWLNESPRVGSPPWDYLSYTTSPAFTSEELRTHLLKGS